MTYDSVEGKALIAGGAGFIGKCDNEDLDDAREYLDENGNKDITNYIYNFVASFRNKIPILFFLLFYSQLICANVICTDFLVDSTITKAPVDTVEQKVHQLKDVVVKASAIQQKGDRTHVFITKEMRRGTVSAAQMLGNLPGFFFNMGEGELTYSNSKNIVVLEDSVEKDINYLKNIQHIRYDRIEIIDHPQGRYQGYDVLINLHRKEHYQGYEGNAAYTQNYKFNKDNGKKFTYNGMSSYISFVRNKWNFYANVKNNFSQNATNFYWENKFPLNEFTERTLEPASDGKMRTAYVRNTNLAGSVDYTINSKRSLSFIYNFNLNGSNTYNSYLIEQIAYSDNVERRRTIGMDYRNHHKEIAHAVGAYYRDYSYRIKWNTYINYRYLPTKNLDDNHKTSGFEMHNHFDDRMNYFRYALNGETWLLNNKVNVAAAYMLTFKNYERSDHDTDRLLNKNHYWRNLFSASTTYDFTTNPCASISGWVELVREKMGETVYHDHPFGGSMMLFYRYGNKGNWLRFNYDCNVEYPDQSSSSSYGYFTDSLTWVSGNPALKTGVVHTFRFWADFLRTFNLQCGVKYAPKAFCSIHEARYGNLANGMESYYSASCMQNTRFVDWWGSFSLTKRLWKDFVLKIDASIDKMCSRYKDIKNHAYASSVTTSMNYYNRKWDLNCTLMYAYTRNVTLAPQYTFVRASEWPMLSIQKFWLDRHLSLMAVYSGMFNLFPTSSKSHTDSPALLSYTQENTFGQQRNYLQIGFIYYFRGGKSVRQYNKQMADEK